MKDYAAKPLVEGRHRTMRTRWQAKLKKVRIELRRRMHASVDELGAYLRSIVDT